MIRLRVDRTGLPQYKFEEYLWLTPGTFHIYESVPRDTGDVRTYVVPFGQAEGTRVIETAQEIEDKINAEKER